MVAVGPNMFYTVTLPCTLWLLDKLTLTRVLPFFCMRKNGNTLSIGAPQIEGTLSGCRQWLRWQSMVQIALCYCLSVFLFEERLAHENVPLLG